MAPFPVLTVVDNWCRHSPMPEVGVRMPGETDVSPENEGISKLAGC